MGEVQGDNEAPEMVAEGEPVASPVGNGEAVSEGEATLDMDTACEALPSLLIEPVGEGGRETPGVRDTPGELEGDREARGDFEMEGELEGLLVSEGVCEGAEPEGITVTVEDTVAPKDTS